MEKKLINELKKDYILIKKRKISFKKILLTLTLFSSGLAIGLSTQTNLNEFTSGSTISASDMNDNLKYLEDKTDILFKARLTGPYAWPTSVEEIVNFQDIEVASPQYSGGTFTVNHDGMYRVLANMAPEGSCLAYVWNVNLNGASITASTSEDRYNINYRQYTFHAVTGDTITVSAGTCGTSDGDDAFIEKSFFLVKSVI